MALNPIDGTPGAEVLVGTPAGDVMTGAAAGATAGTAPGLATVATGLGRATFGVALPGDGGRMLVSDQTGVLRSVDLASGAATTVLDISPEVTPAGEQGLIGVAAHPGFWANGRIFVFFSNTAGDTVLREYRVDPGDQGVVLPGSGRDLLTVPQPGDFTNHKGGWIGFGPDGALYVATGDGGGAGDPLGTGQNPNDLLGAILRIDVDADGFPADPGRNYAIPAGNPFAAGGGAPEVWAYGFRNPYRASFDRGAETLWIADVGQGAREEVDIGAPGANYGWPRFEGDLTYPAGQPAGALPDGIAPPAFAYWHEEGDRSVTGGYVHRGPDSGLQGQYIFGDFVSGRVWALSETDGNGVLDGADRRLLDGTTLGGFRLTSFAEDAEGRIHLLAYDGRLLRLEAGSPAGAVDGGDTLDGGGGGDRVFAGAGDDSLLGWDEGDLLSGMEGTDTLVGHDGADTLLGGAEGDLLWGEAGADLLTGGAGTDTLLAGRGDDMLHGGAGADLLQGGEGADRFRWSSIADSPYATGDVIFGFDGAAGDRLDVSALAPGTFRLIGDAGFAETGAQIRILAFPLSIRVELSVDGGPGDLGFWVDGVAGLSDADFIL
jgi:glucose/arabinose dehydrogenase